MEKEKKKKSKLMIIVAIAVVVIVIVGSVIVVVQQNEEKERIRIEQQEAEYKEKIAIVLKYIHLNTQKGTLLTSEYLKLVKKYSHFSSKVISRIFLSNKKLSEQLNIAKEDNEKVVENMKWLSSNKIDKYKDVYNVVLEMYDVYTPFFESTIDLNFQLYDLDELIEKGKVILEKYNKIKILMPEIEDIEKNLQENAKT